MPNTELRLKKHPVCSHLLYDVMANLNQTKRSETEEDEWGKRTLTLKRVTLRGRPCKFRVSTLCSYWNRGEGCEAAGLARIIRMVFLSIYSFIYILQYPFKCAC